MNKYVRAIICLVLWVVSMILIAISFGAIFKNSNYDTVCRAFVAAFYLGAVFGIVWVSVLKGKFILLPETEEEHKQQNKEETV